MVECLIKNRINFIGFEDYCYIHIRIKNNGVTISELDRIEANNLIKDNNLKQAMPEDYAQPYDRKLGKIFTDGKFKDYINKHLSVKTNLLFLLNQFEK